jgi:hypothetical protein
MRITEERAESAINAIQGLIDEYNDNHNDWHNQMQRRWLPREGNLLPIHGYRWVAPILLYDLTN